MKQDTVDPVQEYLKKSPLSVNSLFSAAKRAAMPPKREGQKEPAFDAQGLLTDVTMYNRSRAGGHPKIPGHVLAHLRLFIRGSVDAYLLQNPDIIVPELPSSNGQTQPSQKVRMVRPSLAQRPAYRASFVR